MKSFILGLALTMAFASAAQAVTLLRIPVAIGDENEKSVDLQKLNAELKAKGVAEIPSYIEISSDDPSPYKTASAVDEMVDKANAVLEKQITKIYSSVPGDQDTKDNRTCYSGVPSEAIGIISSLGDAQYSDQMNIFGWKYKKVTNYVNASADDEDALKEGSEKWRNWRGKGEAILMLSSVGDDGTDVQESLIIRCK